MSSPGSQHCASCIGGTLSLPRPICAGLSVFFLNVTYVVDEVIHGVYSKLVTRGRCDPSKQVRHMYIVSSIQAS